MSELETEFILISDAASHLEEGMFGGAIKRPEPVEAVKKICPQLSVGWGPHRQKAASAIQLAILAGDLTVHAFTQPTADGICRSINVPIDVLRLMPVVRGGLPDHPVRHPISLLRNHSVALNLFAALSTSALHVKRIEFDAWYEKQKSRGRWPSQRTGNKRRKNLKRPPGAPTKQTSELFISIKALVAQNEWSAPDGVAKLARLLRSNGAPLRNTFRRAVDELYIETGDPSYRIIPRKRAKTKPEVSRT